MTIEQAPIDDALRQRLSDMGLRSAASRLLPTTRSRYIRMLAVRPDLIPADERETLMRALASVDEQ